MAAMCLQTGGVDWTVARWDLPSHPLFDPDSAIHPGLELSVNGKRFKKSISEYWKSPQDDLTKHHRGEIPCSLWQDICLVVRGDAANDVAINFMDRWEHARRTNPPDVFDPTFKSGRPPHSKMPRIPLTKIEMWNDQPHSSLEASHPKMWLQLASVK